MNSVSLFFNHKLSLPQEDTLANLSLGVGNFCFAPVRYLFGGREVVVDNFDLKKVRAFSENEATVDNFDLKKVHVISREEFSNSNRAFCWTVIAIALIAPGVIIGSVFKSLAYCSSSTRVGHNYALQHFTIYTIGTAQKPLALEEIKGELTKLSNNNCLNRKINHIVVFAEEGTTIKEDPGFLQFNLKKITLIGAKIIHTSDDAHLDNQLLIKGSWKAQGVTDKQIKSKEDYSFIVQHPVKSVEEAINHVPPRMSFFSLKRFNLVYILVPKQKKD